MDSVPIAREVDGEHPDAPLAIVAPTTLGGKLRVATAIPQTPPPPPRRDSSAMDAMIARWDAMLARETPEEKERRLVKERERMKREHCARLVEAIDKGIHEHIERFLTRGGFLHADRFSFHGFTGGMMQFISQKDIECTDFIRDHYAAQDLEMRVVVRENHRFGVLRWDFYPV